MEKLIFRGLGIHTNSWIYGNTLIKRGDAPGCIGENPTEFIEGKDIFLVAYESIATGLFDYDDVSIFEDDIIYCEDGSNKFIGKNFIVKYDKGMFLASQIDNPTNEYPLCKLTDNKIYVIGNVWKNKELLKPLDEWRAKNFNRINKRTLWEKAH